ncbi:MAG: class I SAM-dependent methyltransferase [Chloroflexi bacterium]|nr:class I SAM-dependent methyltransferase [Chloroflexota bacterium]MCY3959868.1 class I SAM-dependent methyltransferase [Chloroflexota bacterium]
MKSEYVARYAQITASNWWVRSRHDLAHRLTVDGFGQPPRGVLDVGTLDGALLARFSTAAIRLGVDYQIAAHARTAGALLHGGRFSKASACRLPFPTESLHAVLSVDVLEHIDEHTVALDEASRVLTSGGVLVLAVPAHEWLRTSRDAYLGHLRRYARHELEELVQAAGFRIQHSTFFAIPSMFGLLGLRLLEGIGAIPPNQANNAAQMRTGRLNAMLYGLGSAEATLARVLGLPFGSSIAIVAVKP